MSKRRFKVVFYLLVSEKVLQGSGDLHVHSNFSDGSLDLEYLVYLAAKRGLGYISITDHDYFHDYDVLKTLEKKYKIKIIYGAELSCMDFKRNRKVHILCYNLKDTEKLKVYCNEVLKSRISFSEKFINLVSKRYDVVPELFEKYKSKIGCIFETNILHALAECGYSNKISGEFYNEVFKDKEKYDFKHNDVFEILKLIKESGGKAVLAHPSVHNSFDLLDELVLKNTIDGVEVWHPKNKRVDKVKLYDIVKTNNLIATGGTDFHGLYNSNVVRIGDFFTQHVYIERLLN